VGQLRLRHPAVGKPVVRFVLVDPDRPPRRARDQSRMVDHEPTSAETRPSCRTAAPPRQPSSPELQRFIDLVVIPALLERLLRERDSV